MVESVPIDELMFTVDGKERVTAMFAVLTDIVAMDPVPVEELRVAITKYANDVAKMEAHVVKTYVTRGKSIPYQPNE